MRKKLSFQQWLVAILFFFLFSVTCLLCYRRLHPDAGFYAYTESLFLQELTTNPLSLHFALENSSAYSIDESSLSMPVYKKGDALATQQAVTDICNRLCSFHPDELSDDNQYLYSLLIPYMETTRQLSEYPYFDEPLSPSSGAVSELPILLAEYRLHAREDVENYLAILSQIPSYFEGLITYEKEKKEAGFFMAGVSADKVISQCPSIMDSSTLQSGNHFLQTTFEERLRALQQNDVLTQDEVNSYLSLNDRLLTTVVAPAFDKLADELTLLKEDSIKPQGLACFEGGKSYYQALVKLQTGSNRDIDEITTLLCKDINTNYASFLALCKDNPSLKESFMQPPECVPELAPSKILNLLKEFSSEKYPPLPSATDEKKAKCNIKYVSNSLEPYSAPAFYMIPPIDSSQINTIYLNRKDINDRLSLFTTLAHEGYPGHLYQTVYHNAELSGKQCTPLCSTLYYGGFVEGWAMYVEIQSYDYAIHLFAKEDIDTADYIKACKLNRQIQLGLYSLLDVLIHGKGANQADIQRVFGSLGVTDKKVISSVYEYIVEEPANYLKYYLGYLEIIELKKQAFEKWSCDQASDTRSLITFENTFHKFLLDFGPADFGTLNTLIDSQSSSMLSR